MDKDVKTILGDGSGSLLAGVIARHLVKTLGPEKARALLKTPRKLIGIDLPDELTATLGGGLAGLGIVKIARKLMPTLSEESVDWITDLAVMVGEEIDDVVKEMELGAAGAASSAVAASAATGLPVIYWNYAIDPHAPTVLYWENCPCRHHTHKEEEEYGKPDGDKKRRTRAKEAVNVGWHIYPFTTAIRGGARPPRDEDEGWKPGCMCAQAFAEDEAKLAAAKAASAASPAKPAPSSAPPSADSLTGWLGLIRAGKIPGAKSEDAVRLLGYMKEVDEKELDSLAGEIDRWEEVAGLLVAQNKEEFVRLCRVAKSRRQAGTVASAIGVPIGLAREGIARVGSIHSAVSGHGTALADRIKAYNDALAGRGPAAQAAPTHPNIVMRFWNLAIHGTW